MSLDSSRIKVLGIGGAGCNAVEHLLKSGVPDVELLFADTDLRDLSRFAPHQTVQIGNEGGGTFGKYEIGREATVVSMPHIKKAISGAKILIIAAGLGGGTASAAAPLIGRAAQAMGIHAVGVVFTPFEFESYQRSMNARMALRLLSSDSNMLTVVPNENLMRILGKDIDQNAAFTAANDVLKHTVLGLMSIDRARQIASNPAEFDHVFQVRGRVLVGWATAVGPNRAGSAMRRALDAPLVADNDLVKAKVVLAVLTAAKVSLGPSDFTSARNELQSRISPETILVFQTVCSEELLDEVQVAVMVTWDSRSEPL
jgi:cell division protein FtsZ